jgi:uncharacterized protein (DUF58 family)
MVKDLEIEPTGDIWLVVDLNRAVHTGEGPTGTLEYSIIAAASLAAELLAASERRAVGLLAVAAGSNSDARTVLVVPQAGQAQLWQILAALAPVQPAGVALGELLATSRQTLGRRGSLVVITPDIAAAAGDGRSAPRPWTAELLHLKAAGMESSTVLVVAASGEGRAGLEATQSLLARADIATTVIEAGSPLQSILTFRRKRKVLRSTPTGGVVTYEVEEEVG